MLKCRAIRVFWLQLRSYSTLVNVNSAISCESGTEVIVISHIRDHSHLYRPASRADASDRPTRAIDNIACSLLRAGDLPSVGGNTRLIWFQVIADVRFFGLYIFRSRSRDFGRSAGSSPERQQFFESRCWDPIACGGRTGARDGCRRLRSGQRLIFDEFQYCGTCRKPPHDRFWRRECGHRCLSQCDHHESERRSRGAGSAEQFEQLFHCARGYTACDSKGWRKPGCAGAL